MPSNMNKQAAATFRLHKPHIRLRCLGAHVEDEVQIDRALDNGRPILEEVLEVRTWQPLELDPMKSSSLWISATSKELLS